MYRLIYVYRNKENKNYIYTLLDIDSGEFIQSSTTEIRKMILEKKADVMNFYLAKNGRLTYCPLIRNDYYIEKYAPDIESFSNCIQSYFNNSIIKWDCKVKDESGILADGVENVRSIKLDLKDFKFTIRINFAIDFRKNSFEIDVWGPNNSNGEKCIYENSVSRNLNKSDLLYSFKTVTLEIGHRVFTAFTYYLKSNLSNYLKLPMNYKETTCVNEFMAYHQVFRGIMTKLLRKRMVYDALIVKSNEGEYKPTSEFFTLLEESKKYIVKGSDDVVAFKVKNYKSDLCCYLTFDREYGIYTYYEGVKRGNSIDIIHEEEFYSILDMMQLLTYTYIHMIFKQNHEKRTIEIDL